MSLLIKALEQAAKDRDSAKAGSPSADIHATAPASSEPTLEPPPPPRAAQTLDAPGLSIPALDPAPPRAGRMSDPSASPRPAPQHNSLSQRVTPALEPSGPARGVSPLDTPSARPNALSMDPSSAARKTAQTSASMANIDAQHQRARAATVMQASSSAGPAIFAYLRSSPVALLGAIAALFGIGFGIYVYLQVAKPGLFTRQAATRPQQSPAPPVPSVPPAPPATTIAGSSALTPPAGSPATQSSEAIAPANPAVAMPATGSVAPPSTGAVASASATASAPPVTMERAAEPTARTSAPIPASSIIASPRTAEPFRDPGMERAADLPPVRGSIRPARAAESPRRQPAPAATAAADATPPARERISVTPAAAQPRLNPDLSQAYSALQSGNLEDARALYSKVSQSEPLNIDALLGLAYIAAKDNRTDDAVRQYMHILQLNPRHAAAQAALIGLMGRADPIASETRLKILISREPSAFLHFVLGNLYADQSLWSQAQLAYFQAHNLEPDNPDYAYNLAVGLDHLHQSKLALNFYRRAEQLAASQGRSNFNVANARERIGILSSQLE